MVGNDGYNRVFQESATAQSVEKIANLRIETVKSLKSISHTARSIDTRKGGRAVGLAIRLVGVERYEMRKHRFWRCRNAVDSRAKHCLVAKVVACRLRRTVVETVEAESLRKFLLIPCRRLVAHHIERCVAVSLQSARQTRIAAIVRIRRSHRTRRKRQQSRIDDEMTVARASVFDLRKEFQRSHCALSMQQTVDVRHHLNAANRAVEHPRIQRLYNDNNHVPALRRGIRIVGVTGLPGKVRFNPMAVVVAESVGRNSRNYGIDHIGDETVVADISASLIHRGVGLRNRIISTESAHVIGSADGISRQRTANHREHRATPVTSRLGQLPSDKNQYKERQKSHQFARTEKTSGAAKECAVDVSPQQEVRKRHSIVVDVHIHSLDGNIAAEKCNPRIDNPPAAAHKQCGKAQHGGIGEHYKHRQQSVDKVVRAGHARKHNRQRTAVDRRTQHLQGNNETHECAYQ